MTGSRKLDVYNARDLDDDVAHDLSILTIANVSRCMKHGKVEMYPCIFDTDQLEEMGDDQN